MSLSTSLVAPGSRVLSPLGTDYPDLLGQPEAVRVRLLLRREELLRLLLSGHRVKEAAAMLRVSVSTIRTEIRNPYFGSRLRTISAEVFEQVDAELLSTKLDPVTRLGEMAEKALDKLEDLLESSDERVQLRAVDSTLDRHAMTSKTHKIDKTERKLSIDLKLVQRADTTAEEVDRFDHSRTS